MWYHNSHINMLYMLLVFSSHTHLLQFNSFLSVTKSISMDWTRGSMIGRGSSATVSLATSHGKVLAVKSVEFFKSELLQREERIHLSLGSSPYVVDYVGCDTTVENGKLMYNILMEYVPGGTVSDVVRRQGGKLEESVIQSYTARILKGVEYLHSNGVVHCDIKGCNVLVGEDGAKIADFGCAKWIGEKGMRIAGTPVFMAPEVARGEEQGFAADIWAVGCTVVEMATGSPPWADAADPVAVMYQIGFGNTAPEIPSFLSEEAKDFLSQCFRINPEERWSAEQLLKHQFLDESKCNFKLCELPPWCSPSSTLDQEFWNSVEEPQTRTNSVVYEGKCSNSPRERLHELVKAGSSATPGLPNWSLDEDWITIRSNNESKETEENVVEDMHIVSMSTETEAIRTSMDSDMCTVNDASRDSLCTRSYYRFTEGETCLFSKEVEMELCPTSVDLDLWKILSVEEKNYIESCSREYLAQLLCKYSICKRKYFGYSKEFLMPTLSYLKFKNVFSQ